jgi:hypothetical protein
MFTSVDQQGLLRMNFYQTIRHYCFEKLKEFGLEQLAFKKHLLDYLYVAENVWSKLRSEDAETSYISLDNDLNNIESALQWSVANEPITGLRLALAMAEYWDTRNRSGESCFWLEKLLAANEQHQDSHFEIICLAKLELARAKFRLGEFDKSWNLALECLKQSKENNNEFLMTDALLIQSLINVYAHRREFKDEILEQAIAQATSINYKMALLDCYQFKAADKIFSGFAIEGINWAKQSLELAKDCMAIRWEAMANIFLGFGYLQIASFADSKVHFRNALVCTQNLSDQMLPVYSILGLGQVALATQQIQKGCMFLGVLDAFYSKPSAVFVPIVRTMYNATLDHLKSLGFEHLDILMDEGRKIKLNEAIEIAMEDTEDNYPGNSVIQNQVEEEALVMA